MRIPIFTDDPGWQGKQLQRAFATRGIESVFISLRDCMLDLTNEGVVRVPGFSEQPKAAFVRGIAGGTLPQVIIRLNILHALERADAKIYNDVRAIERSVDKAMTSFILKQHQISTPATWICESSLQAKMILQQSSHPLVMKPLFGSQGKGVRLLKKDDLLPIPMEQYVDGVYYLQQYIRTSSIPHDYRVFVIANKAIAAMRRIGESWVSNVAQGGRCESVSVESEIAALAVKASQVLNMPYCGVDIIQSETGELYVLEVNSIPAWYGLQQVTNIDIAQCLVDDFLRCLRVSK